MKMEVLASTKTTKIIDVIMPSLKVDLPTPRLIRVDYFETHREVTFELMDKIYTIETDLGDQMPHWYRVSK